MRGHRDTLFICCDGTSFNLKDKSLVSQFFNELDVPEVNIRSNEDFPTTGYIDRTGADNSSQCDKIYLPGPGAAKDGQYETPGHVSPILNQNKNKISEAIAQETKDQKISSSGWEEFLGVAPDSKKNRTQRIFDKYAPDPLLRLVNGMINGEGREENVQKIQTLLGNVSYKKIVIPCWSRGGVTGMHIAKSLYDMGIKTPVYLFLIDPVPGRDVGLTDETIRYITPNVKACTSLIALGDSAKEFHPQSLDRVIVLSEPKPVSAAHLEEIEEKEHKNSDPELDSTDEIIQVIDDSKEDQDERIINFYPVHGSHGQVADDNQTNTTPAQITRYHWQKFMNHVAGDKVYKIIPDYKDYDANKILELYAETQINAENLYQYKFNLFDKLIYTQEARPITRCLHDYTSRPHLFVNADHHELFVMAHPLLFGDIISGKATVEQIQNSDLGYYSKKMIIANILLKPLQDEIARIPKNEVCAEYKNQLTQLQKEAQNKILSTLPVDNADLREDKTLAKTLSNLPEVRECRDAVKMNRAIFSRKNNYAEKCNAVQAFENSSHSSTAKSIVKCAAQLIGGLMSFVAGVITFATLSPLILFSMVNDAPTVYKATAKIAKISNNTFSFIAESSLSRKASKMLEAAGQHQQAIVQRG